MIYPLNYVIILYTTRNREIYGMPKANLLTRDLYRQIKSMNRDAMDKTINNIYDMGAKDALENAVIDLDMGKLAAEIGTINGIGDTVLSRV